MGSGERGGKGGCGGSHCGGARGLPGCGLRDGQREDYSAGGEGPRGSKHRRSPRNQGHVLPIVWGNMWGEARVCRLLDRIRAEGESGGAQTVWRREGQGATVWESLSWPFKTRSATTPGSWKLVAANIS
jgi:hypothetical protein